MLRKKKLTIIEVLSGIFILAVLLLIFRWQGTLLIFGLWLVFGVVSLLLKKWEIRKINKAVEDMFL